MAGVVRTPVEGNTSLCSLRNRKPSAQVNLSYLDSRGPLPSAVVGLDRDWTAVFLTQPVILVILVGVLE
mgnify:CR=1 FL=1